MKNQIVNDTVTALFNQAGLDEKFRPDFAKAISAVFDAGAASCQEVHVTPALSSEEIAGFRAAVLALLGK
jgi:hypothetical protein